MPRPSLLPVALIAGATASGKSAMALALAERTGGVIINADSAQVYRDLRVVTARPTPADEARADHRLFGHVDAGIACSAATWAADAKGEIVQAHHAGRLPILVGGTGLYLRTLIDGIAPVPDIDPAVREMVRAMPVAAAHTALTREDPQAARRLAPADTTRIARALEVVRSTGKTLADWQGERRGGIGKEVRLVARILLPPRDWLAERCDRRFELMLDQGQDEVRALLARGLSPDLPAMRAIGVREIAGFVEGRLTRDEALAAGTLSTRRYAKRQYTWFSHQPPVDWARLRHPAGADDLEPLLRALDPETIGSPQASDPRLDGSAPAP